IPDEFSSLRPGRVKLRLLRDDPPETLVEYDDVIVQPGCKTLDPRLLRLPIHVPPGASIAPVPTAQRPAIQLHVVDERGGRIDAGLLLMFTHCGSNPTQFRGGRVEMQSCMFGSTIGLW